MLAGRWRGFLPAVLMLLDLNLIRRTSITFRPGGPLHGNILIIKFLPGQGAGFTQMLTEANGYIYIRGYNSAHCFLGSAASCIRSK